MSSSSSTSHEDDDDWQLQNQPLSLDVTSSIDPTLKEPSPEDITFWLAWQNMLERRHREQGRQTMGQNHQTQEEYAFLHKALEAL